MKDLKNTFPSFRDGFGSKPMFSEETEFAGVAGYDVFG